MSSVIPGSTVVAPVADKAETTEETTEELVH